MSPCVPRKRIFNMPAPVLSERARYESPVERGRRVDAHLISFPLDCHRNWSLVTAAGRAVAGGMNRSDQWSGNINLNGTEVIDGAGVKHADRQMVAGTRKHH